MVTQSNFLSLINNFTHFSISEIFLNGAPTSKSTRILGKLFVSFLYSSTICLNTCHLGEFFSANFLGLLILKIFFESGILFR